MPSEGQRKGAVAVAIENNLANDVPPPCSRSVVIEAFVLGERTIAWFAYGCG